MSWDQGSYLDDRELRSSNTNTPQRGLSADNNAGEQQADRIVAGPSPYYQPGLYHYGGFPLPMHMFDPTYEAYAFPEFGGSPSHAGPPMLPQPPVALHPRNYYEEVGSNLSPPPPLQRTNRHHEFTATHSTSSPESCSSETSTKARFAHGPSTTEQESSRQYRDDMEQKMAATVQVAPPHLVETAHNAQTNVDPSPGAVAAAAKLYSFDDTALTNPNADQDVSPIKKVPAKAALKPAPKKKSENAKAKRPSRRTTKAAARGKKTAASNKGTSEKKTFLPTEEELIEAHSARKQRALRTWYMRLTELYEYKVENGHCNVPQKYPKNPPLGTWVNKQRMEYKLKLEGGKHSLTEAKLRVLEEIGFDWGKRKGDHSWEEKFQDLLKFREQHGNCKYPAVNSCNTDFNTVLCDPHRCILVLETHKHFSFVISIRLCSHQV